MNNATILVVEDDSALRDVLSQTLQLSNYQVHTASDGQQALKLLQRYPEITLLVSDVQMQPMDGEVLLEKVKQHYPCLPVILMTAYGTVEKAVIAMQHGASDYLVKPFVADTLLEMVQRFVTVKKENHQQKSAVAMPGKQKQTTQADALIAVDVRSREMVDVAHRVAVTDVTVMITGESGVGKEVVSHYIHQHSARVAGPFVAINCAAIPENMLESVLFGYEKGAFTGAYQSKAGKFEQAQGGTLLLDEITEMDPGLQAKLLRVLQEREVERLGGRKPIALDVRIIATTNRDFHQLVMEGQFREDLYYRLNVFPLNLLPLRERVGDILPLAQRLVERYSTTGQPADVSGRGLPVQLTEAAKDVLVAHPWPGNVRELDNVIQRALILKTGNEIDSVDIHFESPGYITETAIARSDVPCLSSTDEMENSESRQALLAKSELSRDLLSHEKDLIMSALASRGSRKAAAEKLGISPRTLRYKLARLRDAGVAIPA